MNIQKGQWYRMPSGKTAEVCRSQEVQQPFQDGDTEARFAREVTLRFLNSDGAMDPGDFTLAFSFLVKHCQPILFAPPPSLFLAVVSDKTPPACQTTST